MIWVENLARAGDCKYAYRFLVARHEGQKALGKRGLKREDYIKMEIQELG
jgi:hypothetical protein